MHPPLAQSVRIAPCRKPGLAVLQAWPNRVAVAPCHVTAPTRVLAHRVAGRVLRAVLGTVSSRKALCRAPPASYRGSLLHRIAALAALYRDTTVAPQPRYNVLYRDSPLARLCVHTATRPVRRPTVSWAVS